jgi:hypothetical protein
MKFELSRENFENYSNIKFHEHLSSGSRSFPCRKTERDMRTLIIAFRNFVNAPQMGSPALNTEQLVETRKIITVVVNLCLYD